MNHNILMAIAWFLIAVNFGLIGINGVLLRRNRHIAELLQAALSDVRKIGGS
jgi:hypothetical protein